MQHYVINLTVTCGRSMVFCGTLVSSTNKTDCHNIAEILLKVVLNTVTLMLTPLNKRCLRIYVGVILFFVMD
jgi:hypothetical protein